MVVLISDAAVIDRAPYTVTYRGSSMTAVAAVRPILKVAQHRYLGVACCVIALHSIHRVSRRKHHSKEKMASELGRARRSENFRQPFREMYVTSGQP